MAQFPAVIALGALNGVTGFRLDGGAAGDLSGFSISTADVNGDGFDDLIVGANGRDPNFQYSAGSTYVVFGKGQPFTPAVSLAALNGSDGFRLDGLIAGDYSAYSVSGAGDFNGDGFQDFIIGAEHADPGALSSSGSSYVVFGKGTPFAASASLATLTGGNGFRIDGNTAYERSGYAVSAAGDVNGDGFDDVIVGAPGQVGRYATRFGSSYVVFGDDANFGASFNVSALNGANGFKLVGEAPYDYAGHSVSSAGDLNGDGFDDLIVGAYQSDPGAEEDAGSTFVVFGKASFGAQINLGSLNGAAGFRIVGDEQGDESGFSVRPAGDVNGDRFADLIIGAPRAQPNGFSSGSAYVVFGKSASFGASLNLASLNGANGFRLDGIGALDYAGIAVSGAGDVNGDGFDDVIVGAYFDSPNGVAQAGTSYVVFGKASGFDPVVNLAALNGINGFRLDGVGAYDRSGRAVAAGDVNGDGFSDLLVGAYHANPNGGDSGSTYVVFGRLPDAAVNRAGSAADQRILGGNFNDTLSGLAGSDTLDGLAGNDLLNGGAGSDTLRGGAGNDAYVVTDAADTIVEALNSGTDTVRAGVSHTLAPNVEVLILTGAANLNGNGNGLANALTGNGAGNRLNGAAGNDTLTGGGGNDSLTGAAGIDLLVGGAGRDTLTGGGGDRFDFNTLTESGAAAAAADLIVGFEAGTATTFVDRIDLATIDANAVLGGNQAFAFIGAAAFTANNPGKLRVTRDGVDTYVHLNTDNDAGAEMVIRLTGLLSLNGGDFLL